MTIKIINNVIVGFVVCILGYMIGMHNCKTNYVYGITTDTVTVTDTFIQEKPIPIYITKWKTDTLWLNDTTYIPIPIEQKIYQSDEYKLQISGFKADLDYIEVYPRTTYITTEKVSENVSKWQIKHGVQGGLGYGLFQKKFDFYVGYGFQLTF